MSGNKLLAENTIRRFMKLANVDTLTNNFISETFKEEETNEEVTSEEEALEETIEETEDQLSEEEEELESDLDAVEDPEVGEEPEMGAADISLTEEEARLLIDLGVRLKEAMGDEAPADEEAEAPAMDDMSDMEDMGAMGDEAPEDDPANRDMSYMQESQDEIVQEVLKRVTKRLVAEKIKARK